MAYDREDGTGKPVLTLILVLAYFCVFTGTAMVILPPHDSTVIAEFDRPSLTASVPSQRYSEEMVVVAGSAFAEEEPGP